MYVRNFAGLGFDFSSIADTASSLVSTGSKAVSAIKGGGGGGGGGGGPAQIYNSTTNTWYTLTMTGTLGNEVLAYTPNT